MNCAALSEMESPTSHSETFGQNLRPARIPTVLIVEDDQDMALFLEGIFNHLDCRTRVALSAERARGEIILRPPQLVILDWHLDSGVVANEVLEQISLLMDRHWQFKSFAKCKVVTHSCLAEEHVQLPMSDRFDHVGHWRKPLVKSELMKKAMDALQSVGL